MGGIKSIKLWNYKIHKDLKLDPNGESFFIIGDSGEGKSTLIEWIYAAFAQGSFPPDPLSDGAQEGSAELIYEHTNGITYTIRRRYGKGKPLKRFEVISSSGGRMSQEEFLNDVLKSAFDNKFDYDKYFNKANSTVARMEYLIKAFGGDKVFDNNRLIAEKIKERAVIGGQKLMQKNISDEEYPIDDELLESTYATYEKEREPSMAEEAKAVYIRSNSIPIEPLEQEASVYLDIINKRNLLTEYVVENESRQIAIEEEMRKLRLELKDLKKELAISNESLSQLSADAQKDLDIVNEEIAAARIKNELVDSKAVEVYSTAIKDIMDFNQSRDRFMRSLKAFKQYMKYEQEWDVIDKEITDLKNENKEIFINAIPIPELTIEFNDKGEPIPLYNGREFKLGNLSTGESLEITSRIQDALNPSGNNFIILPEAQSMGSKIDGVMEFCKNKNIQAIVEITKRDEKFKIVVTDDARKV